ncbi:assimilatory sulfite reductase (NADPH) hemoprotein subunit [Candidatus Thiothrix sp. Deng01]|uniref:Assimilatory sulfite reductase (NADPH) hemoprotein subunit n=1 Tax=Candidatus Thiothrix phosphatis TaxID=3112415 RepID=A0ABU6D090_9GAMM|nr:assimilatory sulfite reductase (NADPH) hemoprotein subunit [Candidatus Thiothrix sp. Deng01]MEB4591738.1 assimilatory sulfite reductase (NADPH) hemoprotein subunit [Candidatus Thiothrix sp. Deng01]
MTTRIEPKPLNQLAPNGSAVEHIKDSSNYLRGNLVEDFQNPITASISEDNVQLVKFHGSYMQDDRDVRLHRQDKKLEPAYSFMIRLRVPGGDLTAEQWVKLDDISNRYGNGTSRITTRQALQFHGIIKFDMKATIQAMDAALLDSIAGCGDVNRNVMCTPDPTLSKLHADVFPWAQKISDHLLPQSRAYHEIWLDEEQGKTLVAGGETDEVEPLYGKHYLPRKFKVAIAIPPFNDMDVYANDIGLIAIEENGKLAGFNVAVGGGLGMTFGRDDTYPRLASTIGFCTPEQVLDVCFHIVAIQRDYGNRQDRKLSRFKYTLDRFGLDWFRQELNTRLGFELGKIRPFEFATTGDRFGWRSSTDGLWHLGLRLEYGRVLDNETHGLKSALREIATQRLSGFRMTGNQNLILTGVREENIEAVEGILRAYGYEPDASHLSGLRRNSIACVALNTCPQAMAEAERYLPDLIGKLEVSLEKHGLRDDEIKIRMTGCPNGCGRSVLGEIGLIGKSPGRYNLYLGASFNGDRLNRLYRENLDEAAILGTLDELFTAYAAQRRDAEPFGDFVIRKAYV